MKGLKNILFNSKQETLTERSFTRSIAISVFGILLCVIALCSLTWAWFCEDVSSSTNSIQSADCYVSVSVTSDGATVETLDGKYTFAKDKAYKIKMTATGTAKTAYCVLNIGGKDYYTVQIPTDAVTTDNYITFTLQFTTDTPNVEIYTHWGTSSQSERDFANGLYYLDCEAIDPSTLVVTSTKTEPTNATETTLAAETAETERNAERWISLIRKYTEVTELTTPLLNELIEKVVIHQGTTTEDGYRDQKIEIYYRFIGIID